MKIILSSILLFVFSIYDLSAKVKLPSMLGDSMVLQQKSEVTLWGTAKENAKVSVITSWNNKHYSSTANKSGEWELKVGTPAAGGPYQITFSDGEKLTLNNILIGEVWLCSGQSNMEIPVVGYKNQPILNSNEILADAGNSSIRLLKVERATSLKPLNNIKGSWTNSDAEHVAKFSAVGYQFAKILQQQLHVPIGIIESAWGGTNIIGWMNRAGIEKFPEYKILPDTTTKLSPNSPTVLFNGMINPLLKYRIKGIIWYQGESNRTNPSNYQQLMVNMVSEWRRLWNIGEVPFYYVQIAPWKYTGPTAPFVPYVQEAQFKAMSQIPNSGMAVSVDVGSPNTIHPPDKTTISKRLSYWALAKTYGKKGIAYQSPQFKNMTIKGSAANLTFDNAENGFYTAADTVTGFEIAGDDKKFYPATGKITSAGISVQSDKVKVPVAVRYAFTDWIVGQVYGTTGLPLTPFRTDDWPPAK